MLSCCGGGAAQAASVNAQTQAKDQPSIPHTRYPGHAISPAAAEQSSVIRKNSAHFKGEG